MCVCGNADPSAWFIIFVLRDPQPGTAFLSVLGFIKTETVPLGSPSTILPLDVHSTLFPSRVENRGWGFPPGERGSGAREFSYWALMLLASSLPRVQEPFNCFLDFSQRHLICLLMSSLHCGRQIKGRLLVLPSC